MPNMRLIGNICNFELSMSLYPSLDMPYMSLIGNICNFELSLVWSTSETGIRGIKIWHHSMFSDPAVALSYWTGSFPWSICLIRVWLETIAILSWVWVWWTSESGMRGVKIWHRLIFSDPAVPLSYQTGSIPRLICLIWVWSETFAILSWVWVWSMSETGMRGFKFDIVPCSHIQLWLCHIEVVVSLGQYA